MPKKFGGMPLRKLGSRSLLVGLLCCSALVPARAFEIDTGNPDVKVRWDTTIKATTGMRLDERQARLARNPAADEGNYKFDKGDFVANRLDVLTELDFVYQRRYGFRVSAAGWYDAAYADTGVEQNPSLKSAGYSSSYYNNKYSDEAKRYYRGPSGELLDAFVFANTDIAGLPVNMKLGRHTIYWGTSTFDAYNNGIAYGQAPLDARKASAVPGSKLNELFMPVAQFSAQSQFADEWSFQGQYFMEWRASRFPEGGTYFGSADLFWAAPDRAALAPRFTIPRYSALEPKNAFNGSFGLSLAYSPEELPGSTFTAYVRRFDDPAPWLTPQILLSRRAPSAYRLVYPEDVRMLGFSYNGSVGQASVGVDLSFRDRAPLSASGISSVDNEGPRGRTAHINVSYVELLGSTPLYDTGTLTAELSAMHLFEVTHHKELFRGEGYAGCTGNRWDGCATRNFVGAMVRFEPQLLQAIPNVDLSFPIQVRYGLYGNGATSLSGNQGTVGYLLGVTADYDKRYKLALTWSDTYSRINTTTNGTATSGNGSYLTNDRGWLSLSFQTTF